MLILPENVVPELLPIEEVIGIVELAFSNFDRGEATPHPVVREQLGYRAAVYGIKSGFDRCLPVLGLKAGGYWPENSARGLTNHQSTVLLLDPDTGRAVAMVGGNYLTGARTGAASAIASRYLARPDATTLGMIGTGVQASYQLRATLAVRPIERVVAWNPSPQRLAAFGREAVDLGIRFVAAESPEQVVRASDILITVTPSTEAIVQRDWVRPGTHINAMGADTIGKQELAVEVVTGASIYVDVIEQAITIGECQHAFRQGLIDRGRLGLSLGGLASGRLQGRVSDDEITLFDGTGTALQDLAAAWEAVRRARAMGTGFEVAF